MIDRRRCVKVSTGAANGGILGLEHLALARKIETAGGRSLNRIGVQFYTVRNLMEKDFEGTREAFAEIGFNLVEFFKYFGR